MSNLTFLAPASSFGGLMNTATTDGLTTALQVIQDGFGNNSTLSLSTTSMNINTTMGGLFIDGVQLASTATQIDRICKFANFSNFKFLSAPRGTTEERPDPPEIADFRYNTDIDGLETYTGESWETLGAGGSVTLIDVDTNNTNLVISGAPITTTGTINISLSDVLSGLTSVQVGALNLYTNVISTQAGNSSIVLSPNGTGIIELTANTEISPTKTLKFFAENDTNYITFRAGASAVNQSFTWPLTAPTAGQALAFVSGSALGWVDFISPPVSTTLNALPRFSNTSGSIKNSGVILDDSQSLTGLLSATFGNISVNTISNTISTISNNDLKISPNGTGKFIINANTGIGTTAPENPLHVVGSAQFKGITSGWTDTGLIKSQKSLVIPQGSSDFVDFPIGSFDGTTLFVSVKIIAMKDQGSIGAANIGDYAETSMGAQYTIPASLPYALIHEPPASSISFSFTRAAASTLSGTWTISGSNLRLTINHLVFGEAVDMYLVISSESFLVKSTTA